MDEMRGGYQPTGPELDISNPPQGGSGVPQKTNGYATRDDLFATAETDVVNPANGKRFRIRKVCMLDLWYEGVSIGLPRALDVSTPERVSSAPSASPEFERVMIIRGLVKPDNVTADDIRRMDPDDRVFIFTEVMSFSGLTPFRGSGEATEPTG